MVPVPTSALFLPGVNILDNIPLPRRTGDGSTLCILTTALPSVRHGKRPSASHAQRHFLAAFAMLTWDINH